MFFQGFVPDRTRIKCLQKSHGKWNALLQTSTAEIVVGASGDVTVWAADILDVSISGSGNVEYYGDPAGRKI